jgi:small-conductance mechanosensitive channel
VTATVVDRRANPGDVDGASACRRFLTRQDKRLMMQRDYRHVQPMKGDHEFAASTDDRGNIRPMTAPFRAEDPRPGCSILTIVVLLLITSAGHGTPAPVTAQPPLTRAQADELLDTLKDPEKRASVAAVDKPVTSTVAPTVLLSRTLQQLTSYASAAGDRLAIGFRGITDFPALSAWAGTELSNPAVRAQLAAGTLRIVGVFLAVFTTGALLRRSIKNRVPGRGYRAGREPASAGRLWSATGRVALQMGILIIVALVGDTLLLFLLMDRPVARSVGFAAVNGYLIARFMFAVTEEMLVAKKPIRRGTKVLLGVLVGAIAIGLIGGDVMTKFGAAVEVGQAFEKLVALVVHLLLIVLVIRTRRPMAAWIRRQAAHGKSLVAVGEALAAVWPTIAVIVLAGWWLAFAMDIPDAYHRILRFVIATIAILVTGRVVGALILNVADRRLALLTAEERNTVGGRLAGYSGLVRAALRATLIVLTLIALMEAWGLAWVSWFDAGHTGHAVLVFLGKMLLLVILGIVCWEAADAAFEARVSRLTQSASMARATRLRTLQPIIRVALIITLSLLIVMTALSEVGINVGPLLAGAGILGVALGFGSQILVQEFITGIFLLVEDAVDVGDWVTVGGLSGTVEHLSIRTIRLRAGDGSVHLIPFSSVTSVTNTNRGVGNAAVTVNIDPGEDTDRVSAILDELVKDMRKEPAYSDAMRSDLQLWGVDKVDAAMTTIAGQIVCTDAGRWTVQREFNRRLKKRFEQEGIALGLPLQEVRILRTRPAGA